jgi:hypothetical protein
MLYYLFNHHTAVYICVTAIGGQAVFRLIYNIIVSFYHFQACFCPFPLLFLFKQLHSLISAPGTHYFVLQQDAESLVWSISHHAQANQQFRS